ncbi:MAG: bifunctional precorrin-2 dehydrogenase/sirohydrochlorin ferrochelatase [Thaumarchaeota archaeon]|nr:bifunctional precorrin-2 dehydrogenase/sirohydrochlorin ferrochelatase [Nitrososphaerota archaeon]
MLIDVVLAGKQALIVGEGKEPEYKAVKLLDAKANVTVIGESFTDGLRSLASKSKGRVRLVQARPTAENVLDAVEETDPRIVFISTGRGEVDEELSEAVRSARKGAPLVCVVDEPRLNDFNMPAIAKIGDIRVGVSTGGKSPAMAGLLRDKIEKAVTRQDVLQVKLQGYIRREARKLLKDAASRKEFAYEVIGDRRVGALLRKGDYAGARKVAEEMLHEASAEGGAEKHA